jgi:hypothetical protein
MNVIHPFLIKSYKQTLYEAWDHAHTFTLTIGAVNQSCAQLLQSRGYTMAAFLTAENPLSQIKSEQENQEQMGKMLEDVQQLGLEYLEGHGKDPSGQWTPEKSILILGIPQHQAELLADKYQQHAYVWLATQESFASLRLRSEIKSITPEEKQSWIKTLPAHLQKEAHELSDSDLPWFMTLTDSELEHWLNPQAWPLNQTWPLTRPDGSAMGIGTEMDRMFKLISMGMVKMG